MIYEKLYTPLFIFLLLFASCSNANQKEVSAVAAVDAAAVSSEPESLEKNAVTTVEENTASPIDIQTKEIIKTAELVLEVKNGINYANQIPGIIKRYGGYISKENSNLENSNAQTTLVIKVPVARFDSLLDVLVTRDAKQLQKNISSEVVTSEFIDTRARLETRKATRNKYLEFLQKASKVEDVLKIQQEINNIQEEIESAEARLAYLSGQARFSTINLTYFEPGSSYHYDSNPSFGTRVAHAFKNGASILVEIFIAFITAWPFWVGGIILFFIIKRLMRKKPEINPPRQ